jgi:hypothetical protein
MYFFYYPNNAHTKGILKNDTISNDLKKCFNNKMQMPLKKNEYLHDDKI